MSSPASRRQATTSLDVTKPSQPTKRRNIWPVLPPSRLPRFVKRSSRPISSDAGHWLRNLPKLPCSLAMACTNCAFSRTDMILAPLRTIRLSLSSPSQNSSGWKASLAGLKPRKAFSKSGHLFSMTLQAKTAENTSLVSALVSDLAGKSFASPFGPPLRFSALARMVLKEIITPTLFQRRQKPRHQPAALGKAFDRDMFVEGMRVRAAHAETVERRDADGASKIAVGAAAGAAMGQLLAEPFGDAFGLLVERHGAGIRLPDRTGDAAGDLEGHLVVGA